MLSRQINILLSVGIKFLVIHQLNFFISKRTTTTDIVEHMVSLLKKGQRGGLLLGSVLL